MLTLDARLHIPAEVSSTSVADGAILVNLVSGKYYALRESGMRFWELLKDGKSLRAVYQTMLNEYVVVPEQLEADLLKLLDELIRHGLLVQLAD